MVSRIMAFLFGWIRSAPPHRREIWLRFHSQGYFYLLKPIHWKGWILLIVPLILVGLLKLTGYSGFPHPALRAAGALVFVAVYWLLFLDHTDWERS